MSKTFNLANPTNKNLLIDENETYYDPILENKRKIDLTDAKKYVDKKISVYYDSECTNNITNIITLYRKKGIFVGVYYIIEPSFIYENSVPKKDVNNIIITISVNIYFNVGNIFYKKMDKKYLPHLNLQFNVNIPQDLSIEYTLASDIKEKIIFFNEIKTLNEETVEYKYSRMPFDEDINIVKENFNRIVQDFIFSLFDPDNFNKYIIIGQDKVSLF